MNCEKCRHLLRDSHFDHRTLSFNETCDLTKKKIDMCNKKAPDWCPIKSCFPPEMPDSIAGIPVSDLLFIANALEGHVDILEKIKDGYKFGYSLGYEHGFKEFHSQLAKSFERINTEPIRFERAEDFDFTKVKLELAPPTYNLKDAALDMAARLYGKKLTDVPKVINVVTPSTDGDDKK